jgi:acyl carrier protein
MTDVLGIDEVGSHDNFFELGGDSLLAVQLIARVGSVLRLELSLLEFFETPTVEAVAAKLASASDWGPAITCAGHRRVPLSSAQQRLWFIDRLGRSQYRLLHTQGNSATWSVGSKRHFKQRFDGLLGRHEALRTVFVEIGGEPVQEILSETKSSLRFVDLSEYQPRFA